MVEPFFVQSVVAASSDSTRSVKALTAASTRFA
jgi:hypothetical protein